MTQHWPGKVSGFTLKVTPLPPPGEILNENPPPPDPHGYTLAFRFEDKSEKLLSSDKCR